MSTKLKCVKDVTRSFVYGHIAHTTSRGSITYYAKRNTYYYEDRYAVGRKGACLAHRKVPIARRFAVNGNSKITTLMLLNSEPVIPLSVAAQHRANEVWTEIYKDDDLKNKTYTAFVPLTSASSPLHKIIEDIMKRTLNIQLSKIWERDMITARDLVIKNIEFLIPGTIEKVDPLVRHNFNNHVAAAERIRSKKGQLPNYYVSNLIETTTRTDEDG